MSITSLYVCLLSALALTSVILSQSDYEEELFLTTHAETSNVFGNAIFVCADEEHEDINITWYVNERPLDDLNLTGVHAGRNYDSCGCVIFTNLSLEYNGYTIQCRDYNSACGCTRISNIIPITIQELTPNTIIALSSPSMASPPPTTVNSAKNTAKNTAVSIQLEIIGLLVYLLLTAK